MVSGGDSGCILGCILGIRGVLYSVRGAGDRNPKIEKFNLEEYLNQMGYLNQSLPESKKGERGGGGEGKRVKRGDRA